MFIKIGRSYVKDCKNKCNFKHRIVILWHFGCLTEHCCKIGTFNKCKQPYGTISEYRSFLSSLTWKKFCHRDSMYPQVHAIQRLNDISKFSWNWNLLSFQVCSLVKLTPHRRRGKSWCICIRLHPLLFLLANFCSVESILVLCVSHLEPLNLICVIWVSNAYLSFFLVQLKLQIATHHLTVQLKHLKHCRTKDYRLIDHCWMMQSLNNKVYT
jgi:hypothetical protein